MQQSFFAEHSSLLFVPFELTSPPGPGLLPQLTKCTDACWLVVCIRCMHSHFLSQQTLGWPWFEKIEVQAVTTCRLCRMQAGQLTARQQLLALCACCGGSSKPFTVNLEAPATAKNHRSKLTRCEFDGRGPFGIRCFDARTGCQPSCAAHVHPAWVLD